MALDDGGTSEHDLDPADPDRNRWRPVSRTRTYELVLDQVEEQIVRGELRVGDRLPSERDLASLLGVSRATVREAIRALEVQGVVQMATGSGPDSGTVVAALTGQALTQLLRLHVGLANFTIQDIVEARVMLERWSVGLAIAHAQESDLERMRELLSGMDDPAVERPRFNELDTAFHVAIAEAGGNRLVADLTAAIRSSLRYVLLTAFVESPDWDNLANRLRAEHRGIYDALAGGNSSVAADRVESHIRVFFARFEPGRTPPG